MHISEGVLSPAVLGGGIVLTAIGTGIGLRKADYSRLTTAAVLSSVFFVGSLVRVPLGPGSVHLILNGLLGLFLGWAVFPSLLVALLLQAILFSYGGVAVLGVNVFDMAFPALVCHYLFRGFFGVAGVRRMFGAFCSGALSVAGAALCTALALGFTDEGFWTSAKILFLAHIPVMAAEGCVTALIIAFIAKNRPELLRFGGGSAKGDSS
ncbi:MAG: cobalt transporter CbiM [Planctomycetota bacterium]|jgi:cobalt/nickel transport system permease protein|nr:cobalt transporter CbiM [Planctomycetota bacterium]